MDKLFTILKVSTCCCTSVLRNWRWWFNYRCVWSLTFNSTNRLCVQEFIRINFSFTFSFNDLNTFKFRIINLNFTNIGRLYHTRISIASLFLLIGFLSKNFFHMMNLGFLILIIQICSVMHEFITLPVDFGYHLILLVHTRISITRIVLRLICRFYAIVWSCIAAMGLPTCSQQVVRVIHIQHLIWSSSTCTLRSCPTSTSVLAIPKKRMNKRYKKTYW